jgi:predicted dehydrogenase
LRLNGMVVQAVGSRAPGSAKRFASHFAIPNWYSSYEELAADPSVDVIYVATPHSLHAENALLALRYGKHVLIEKPFTVNAAQARAVVEEASRRGLLVLEAMWTRFLPHMIRVRQIIAQGKIGQVRTVIADHGQVLSTDPEHRLNNPALGGGALLDLGIYPVSLAVDILGLPAEVQAISRPTATGVDAQISMLFSYDNGSHALLQACLDARGPMRASIIGSEGRIEISSVWYEPAPFDVYDRADKLVEHMPDSESAAAVEITASMAMLRADQARLVEAEQFARQAVSMSRAKGPEAHPLMAASSEALGHVLVEKGAYAEAIPILEEAVRMRSDDRYSASDQAGCLYELGNAYFYAGRYKESEAVNRRVLRMNQDIYGDRHPRVAEALVNLGAIQQDLGNYAEAERFQRQALETTRAFYGDTHYRTAAGFTMVARSLVFQKKYEEAAVLLQQAVAIQERVFGKVHPRVASAVNELGTVALQRGDFAEAKANFTRMADIYRSVYAGNHYLMGTALSNLGSAYLGGKENHRAEALYREAVAIFTRTQSAEHLNTAIARVKLGRALLRQRRFGEAEAEVATGYRILQGQMNPSVSWLAAARKDLAEIYDALGKTNEASALRAFAVK